MVANHLAVHNHRTTRDVHSLESEVVLDESSEWVGSGTTVRVEVLVQFRYSGLEWGTVAELVGADLPTDALIRLEYGHVGVR